MDRTGVNDIEVASPEVVHAAGRNFAAALAQTPQFKAFEQAYDTLSQDSAAQEALLAYQTKAEAVRTLRKRNTPSEAEYAELERLKNDYLGRPTVLAYTAAEAELTALCQQAAGMISAAIGLNYAAVCGASCCG
jgi:cell fate (sporulation/competence/biofilm development) regulator YlbF (YheA/YmcA/DUF963 family)